MIEIIFVYNIYQDIINKLLFSVSAESKFQTYI